MTLVYKKLKMASDIFHFVYEVKKHQLRLRHPEFDDAMLHVETMKLIDAASR